MALKILAYHQIVAGQPHNIHAVSLDAFQAHMTWLCDEGYRVIAVEDYVKQLNAGQPGEPRSVAVTFDDGYRDNYTAAMPVLAARNLTATIFLVAAHIGGQRRWGQDAGHGELLLSWDEIREMQAAGIQFGAHTCTHPDLTRISLDAARREIVDSRRIVEDGLGRPVVSFCYPYSAHTPAIKSLVQEAGFRTACTIRPDYVGAAGSDPFQLQRITILAADTLADFQAKMRGSWQRQAQWHAQQTRAHVRRLLRSMRG